MPKENYTPGNVSGSPNWKNISLRGEEGSQYNFTNVGIPYADSEMTRKIREAFQQKYGTSQKIENNSNNPADKELQAKLDLLKQVPMQELKKLASKYNKSIDIEEDNEDIENEDKHLIEAISINNNNEEGRGGEKKEMENNNLGEVTSSIVKDITNVISSAVKNALKRESQTSANEPDPCIEKPTQKKVQMPSNEEQDEITTSKEEAEQAGSIKNAQQAELGEEAEKEEKYEVVKKVSPEEIKNKNNNVRGSIKSTSGAGRPKTDIDSGKLVREGQQAELGEEGEEDEDILEVKKRDLGEVNMKGERVSTPEVKEKPTQRKVEMPDYDDEEDEGVISSQESKVGPLPGARKIQMPSNEDQFEITTPAEGNRDITAQDSSIYQVKFVRKATKLDSYWKVYAEGKPLFAISLRQAFGDGLSAVKEWPQFKSVNYGRALLEALNTYGAKRTLDNYYTDDKGIVKVSFYKQGQITGEEGQEPTRYRNEEEYKDVPNMSLSEEKTEELEEPGKIAEAPVADLLANVLAPLIATSEDYSIDDIISQLESLFSDEKSSERFKGILSEKVDTLKEETNEKETDKEERITQKEIVSFLTHPHKFINYTRKIKADNEDKCINLQKKLDSITEENRILNEKLASYEKKDQIRKKIMITSSLVQKMLKKGVITPNDYKNKIKELMGKNNEALKELNNLLDNLPNVNEKKAIKMGVRNLLPGQEPSEEITTGNINNLKGLFTTVPTIDVNSPERFAKKVEK